MLKKLIIFLSGVTVGLNIAKFIVLLQSDNNIIEGRRDGTVNTEEELSND